MSNADEILKLKQLLDNNIITNEEFEKKKQELLNDNTNNSNANNTINYSQNNTIPYKKIRNKRKSGCLIVFIRFIFIFSAILGITATSTGSNQVRKFLMNKYNFSETEADSVINTLDECGYSKYYSNYRLVKGMDNDEIPGSIEFDIYKGNNIVGFVDIKDNVVCQIQYSDKILFQNGSIQHTLSEYLISSDEGSSYITKTQEIIKSTLKSPSTAKFPWDFSEYGVKKENGSVIVQGYVDSQNGFGAMVRATYQVTYTNNTVTSLIFDGKEYMK